METPFVFGKLANENNFTDRKEETKQLIENFNSLANIILISPRRWGKSSLVQKASKETEASNKELRFCFLDVYNTRTEEQFYQHLAAEVLKISATKMEILLENAGKFMGKFLPKLSFSPDSQNGISLSLDWKEVKKQPDDVLNMAEKLALEKGWKIIICIDEFQNISTFEDPLAFQKKLRSHWQKHQNVSYCLYGSKRHMLMDVFTNPSMPFYKFGNIMFLEKIKKEDWILFIGQRFDETKKQIDKNLAGLIAELTECHSYYVQQLAQQCWFRTRKKCTREIVMEAHQGIINQLSMFFQMKTDELTNAQINFLRAIIDGVKQLSSKGTLSKYDIGTSANVLKVKKSLENKEIIDIVGQNISLLDPMYKSWLMNQYFQLNR